VPEVRYQVAITWPVCYRVCMRKMNTRSIAAVIVAVSAFITIAAAFGESFHGLYVWASLHELTGGAAWAFPLIIDTFIITGEAALYIAGRDTWDWRGKFWPWVSVLGGLTISVLFNTGRVHTLDWTTHFTDAIPPAAATAALMVGLVVLKRLKRSKAGKTEIEKVPVKTPGETPVAKTPRKPVTKPQVPDSSKELSAYDVLANEPKISTNELAKRISVSWATADKYRKNYNKRGMEA
jgi:Protein of unknown function (DUF2637)